MSIRVRIALSGGHATGKSTLMRELAPRLPGTLVIEEPYYLLADEGHAFSDPPTTEDFELLFERSVSLIRKTPASSVLFDRSPADYLAYLTALRPDAAQHERVAAAAAALATLDLVVFVPIERPDRIQTTEAPRLRQRVDRVLREMLVDRSWGIDVPVVEVKGAPNARADQVQTFLKSLRGIA